MNLGMYIINKLFHGYFACTIFIHSLCKTNSLAALVRLFHTQSHTVMGNNRLMDVTQLALTWGGGQTMQNVL